MRRDAAIPLLRLDSYVRYLLYTSFPFEKYTSEFRMNNFLPLTGMFLLISAVKQDRGQNYADIY